MTFLIDENLSFRLKRLLLPEFPGCMHVADFGLLTASDDRVHECARQRGLAILSKDDDFRRIVDKQGQPPKLVFVALGNAATDAIAARIRGRKSDLDRFLMSSDGVFELT